MEPLIVSERLIWWKSRFFPCVGLSVLRCYLGVVPVGHGYILGSNKNQENAYKLQCLCYDMRFIFYEKVASLLEGVF